VSDYQSRGQGGWPSQPPADGEYGQAGQGYGPGSYDQATHGQATHGQGAYAQQPGVPPRRRRRKRWPVVLLILVILILVAGGIGDQVAKGYAQNDIAKQVQQSGLSAKPSVSIKGWPFLTQVLGHDLKTVDISENNVTADGSKVPFNFTATATGVHLNSSFNGATVDQINGQVLLPFSSVAGLLPISGATVSADPGAGPDAVKADLGIASVTGTVKQSGANQINIQLDSGSGLGSILGAVAGNSFTIDIPKLPAGLVVKSVSVTSQGIIATAVASHTTFSQ
jgi:LmeA-like phospholipid-binding